MGRKVYKDTSEENENNEEQSSRHERHRTNESGAVSTSGAFLFNVTLFLPAILCTAACCRSELGIRRVVKL